MAINYKQLAEGLIDTLCEREDVTEVVILLLQKGYSNEEIKELNFSDDDIEIASEELKYRITQEEQC